MINTIHIAGCRSKTGSNNPHHVIYQGMLLTMKSAHGFDYLALLRTAHSSEKRKAQEAIRQIFRDRTIALTSAKVQTHRRQMQRQIVEHGQNFKTSEV